MLRFVEGPARLTIHKALRYERSRVPEAGLAFASLESVVYGPLQPNHVDLVQYWLCLLSMSPSI